MCGRGRRIQGSLHPSCPFVLRPFMLDEGKLFRELAQLESGALGSESQGKVWTPRWELLHDGVNITDYSCDLTVELLCVRI